MNTPPSSSGWAHSLLQPRVFFPLLAILVVLSVLLTPQATHSDGKPMLSSYSTAAGGASGLRATARGLGWRVAGLEQPLSDTLSADAVYAVLVSDAQLTTEEMRTLLGRVRAGASLLILAGDGMLKDSLHIGRSDRHGDLLPPRGDDSVACGKPARVTLRNLSTALPLVVDGLSWSGPLPDDTVHFALLRAQRMAGDSVRPRRIPAIVGIPYGRGRIVAVSDDQLLTNDVIRACRWGAGLSVVRALEWLSQRDSQAQLATIVFDEFHHGFGPHSSTMHAVGVWLWKTASGRTTLQIIAAALLLLIAAAPRPVPPLPRTVAQRRSPLEHVGALAQAYEQVRATRTAARLLVQGLRRRLARGVPVRRVSDEDFLTALAARRPMLARDAAAARDAMARPVDAPELIEIAQTIDRIERSVRS